MLTSTLSGTEPRGKDGLAGYGRREDRELASEAGFDHYFVKPVDVDALLAVIATLE